MTTEEQDSVLEGIFTFHGWDYERVDPSTIQCAVAGPPEPTPVQAAADIEEEAGSLFTVDEV